MLLCLLFFAFQEFSISTIGPGNVFRAGSFDLEIPQGTLLVAEEHLPLMFRVMGAEHIPNCVAMYIDNSDNWDYSISVQHYQDMNVILEPQVDFPGLKEAISRVHLIGFHPVDPPGAFVIEPKIDLEERSFCVGLKYSLTDGNAAEGEQAERHEVVIARKIWVWENEVLIETLRTTPSTFETFRDVIQSIFSSVRLTSTQQSESATSNSAHVPISYVNLIGLKMQTQPSPDDLIDSATAEEPRSFGLLAGILFGIGVVALVLAYKLKTAKSNPSPENND